MRGVPRIDDGRDLRLCGILFFGFLTIIDIYDSLTSNDRPYKGTMPVHRALEILDEIDDWRDYRNEIVHGLMNKNLDSLYEDIEKRVMDGKRYSELLDNQLRYIKKGNAVRKVLGLQNN